MNAAVLEKVAESRYGLGANLLAPRVARAGIRLAMRSWRMTAAADVAQLLVSELVTNAVTHSDPVVSGQRPEPILVAVHRLGDGVFVVVADCNSGIPILREARSDDENFRGLRLVKMLADKWGREPRPGGGNMVWFVLRCAPDGA